jgi:hypothetical protein
LWGPEEAPRLSMCLITAVPLLYTQNNDAFGSDSRTRTLRSNCRKVSRCAPEARTSVLFLTPQLSHTIGKGVRLAQCPNFKGFAMRISTSSMMLKVKWRSGAISKLKESLGMHAHWKTPRRSLGTKSVVLPKPAYQESFDLHAPICKLLRCPMFCCQAAASLMFSCLA